MSKNFKFSKKNISSLNVMQTLKLLLERDLTMEELISLYYLYFNERNTNFVMSKYINTCRFCGINIPKINNKYTITNFPIGINFSVEEISLFEELQNCCERLREEELSEEMLNILFKVRQRVENPLTIDCDQRNKNANVKLFEKAMHEKLNIKMVLNEGKSIPCEPAEITIKDNEPVFIVFDKNGRREVLPKDIKTIRFLPQKSKQSIQMSTTVVFEMRNPLSKKYQVRSNEQIMRVNHDGSVVISNRFEEKDKLLRRLMRYGDLCKIASPKCYADELKTIVEKTIKNYS